MLRSTASFLLYLYMIERSEEAKSIHDKDFATQVEYKLTQILDSKSYKGSMCRFAQLQSERDSRSYILLETLSTGIPVLLQKPEQPEKQLILMENFLWSEQPLIHTAIIFKTNADPILVTTKQSIASVSQIKGIFVHASDYVEPLETSPAKRDDLVLIDKLLNTLKSVNPTLVYTPFLEKWTKDLNIEKLITQLIESFNVETYSPFVNIYEDYEISKEQNIIGIIKKANYTTRELLNSLFETWKTYPEFLTKLSLLHMEKLINQKLISLGLSFSPTQPAESFLSQNHDALKTSFNLLASEFNLSAKNAYHVNTQNPQINEMLFPSSISNILTQLYDEDSHLYKFKWAFLSLPVFTEKTELFFVKAETSAPFFGYIPVSHLSKDAEQFTSLTVNYSYLQNMRTLIAYFLNCINEEVY